MIRPFRPSDADAVSSVVRTTMRVSNAADYPIDQLTPLIQYFSPEKVAALATERICLVAESDGQVVATAALDGCELVTFFVLPTYQGQRIGASLLEALEAIAPTVGCRRLLVHASRTGVAFYERHGYLRTGTVRNPSVNEQIELAKDLAPASDALAGPQPGRGAMP